MKTNITELENFMRGIIPLLFFLVLSHQAFGFESLQYAYNMAQPAMGYDKYVQLDPDLEYQGDLVIESAGRIRIDGGGAKIFPSYMLQSIKVENSTLDISGCVFIMNMNSITYGIGSDGKIFQNTIYGNDHSGIYIREHNPDPGIEIYDNIIANCENGIMVAPYYYAEYIAYNIVFNSNAYNYAIDNC